MTFRFAVRLALVLAIFCAATARAQSVDAMLDRAAKAWARVKTTRGSFEQTVTNSLTGSSATARGQFLQQRPNKLAIMFTEPSGDRIVSDGKAVWIYLPSSAPGQVVKRSATDDAAQPMDLVGRFLENPRAKYDIVAGELQTVGGRAGRQFTLTPKAGTNPDFIKATVWVDTADALIRQFEVVESSGVTRRVRITALDVNAAVDRNAFVFRPPRGVRVLER